VEGDPQVNYLRSPVRVFRYSGFRYSSIRCSGIRCSGHAQGWRFKLGHYNSMSQCHAVRMVGRRAQYHRELHAVVKISLQRWHSAQIRTYRRSQVYSAALPRAAQPPSAAKSKRTIQAIKT
jgi:hypothetical protein